MMAHKKPGNILTRWLGAPTHSGATHGGPSAVQSPALPKGLTPINQYEAGDVFIVGYPKSGNTWSQCLIGAAIFGLDLELSPYALVKDLVPDVHDRVYYRRYSSPAFFKSHALPDPAYRKVIYLLRDGRDVMVSYHHFLEAMHGRKLDLSHLIHTGELLFPSKWHEHVEQWLANPHKCEMVVVRYEEMKQDPVGQLRRMCEFAGLQRDTATLEKAAQQASFDNLRRRETQWNTGEGRWPKDKHFFRRGVSGSYKDEMAAEALKLFMEEAGVVLRKMGYLGERATS